MKYQKENQDLSSTESIKSIISSSSKDLSIKNKKSNKNSSKLGKKKTRQNNSLDHLTKKFAEYVYTCDSDKINLNDAIKVIKINKRRIYDITNVFEGKKRYKFILILGIGLIKKVSRNQIKIESKFYELYKKNFGNSLIELNEENNETKSFEKEFIKDKNKKLVNEINYIKQLNFYLDKKLLLENENNNIINIENLDEILDIKDNILKNIEYKDSNKSLKCYDNQKVEKLNLNNENKLNNQNVNNNKENKSNISLSKVNAHSFSLNNECIDFFQCENNQNFFNFEIPKINKFNFSLEKGSLICDLSSVDNYKDFICEN